MRPPPLDGGMKPFEIFRTGKHTSSQGATLTFGDVDLAAIASGYNPDLHQAPLVVGHPKQDAPAYGWVKSLGVRGDRLVAEPDQINPAFAEMVRDGSFKKVSAAFYQPTSPNNPTPGQYHLRHVGFLGAEAPAVKGLKAIEFSDGEDLVAFADIELADFRHVWAFEGIARVFRGIREYFIASADVETADRLIPAYEIEQINQLAADTRAEIRAEDAPRAHFSETEPKETTMTKTPEQRQAELDAREAALNARETKVKTDETAFSEKSNAAQAKADAAFVAEQVAAGRLPVGFQATATALFSELADEELTFSEGDQEVKTTSRAAFRKLLSGLPIPVATGEVAVGDGPDFSDPIVVAGAIRTEIADAKTKGEVIGEATALARIKNRR